MDYIAKSNDGDVAVTAIQQAVLDVIMPQMSTETESIVKQRKKPRKRVQMKYGETSPESMKRQKQHEKHKLKKSKRKAPHRKVIPNKISSSKPNASSQSSDQSSEESIQPSAKEFGSSTSSKMKGISATFSASLQIDDLVVVCYNDRKYLGQIQCESNDSFLISFLQHVKSTIYIGGLFVYPNFKDVAYVKDADIFG